MAGPNGCSACRTFLAPLFLGAERSGKWRPGLCLRAASPTLSLDSGTRWLLLFRQGRTLVFTAHSPRSSRGTTPPARRARVLNTPTHSAQRCAVGMMPAPRAGPRCLLGALSAHPGHSPAFLPFITPPPASRPAPSPIFSQHFQASRSERRGKPPVTLLGPTARSRRELESPVARGVVTCNLAPTQRFRPAPPRRRCSPPGGRRRR